MIRCTYSRSHNGKHLENVDILTNTVFSAKRLMDHWNDQGSDDSYEIVRTRPFNDVLPDSIDWLEENGIQYVRIEGGPGMRSSNISNRTMKADSIIDLSNSLLGWEVIYKQDFRALDKETTIAARMLGVDATQAQRELVRLEGTIENFIDDLREMLGEVKRSQAQSFKVAGQSENKVEDASRIPKRFGREEAIADRIARRMLAVNKFTRKDIVWMNKGGQPFKTMVLDFHFNGGKGYTYTVDGYDKPVAESELSMIRPKA